MVNTDPISIYLCPTRASIISTYVIGFYRSSGCPSNLRAAGTSYISIVIVDISVVNDGRIVNNTWCSSRYIVIVQPTRIQVSMRHKSPVMVWNMIICAKRNVDGYAGCHRCPSIITSTLSPCNPCRAPFITGNPHPTKTTV